MDTTRPGRSVPKNPTLGELLCSNCGYLLNLFNCCPAGREQWYQLRDRYPGWFGYTPVDEFPWTKRERTGLLFARHLAPQLCAQEFAT